MKFGITFQASKSNGDVYRFEIAMSIMSLGWLAALIA